MSMARQKYYMTGDENGSQTYKSSMSCGPDIAQFDVHSKNNNLLISSFVRNS